MNSSANRPLPYTDSKPVGAADFYAAINATFRFILEHSGLEGLRRYWTELGRGYYAPVTERWRAGGLPAVADYWRAFFAAEPAAVVEVETLPEEIVVRVQTCPAIAYLRAHGRAITPCFCQHCFYVSAAIGEAADIGVRIAGGAGTCVQRFAKTGHFPEPQEPAAIRTVEPA